MFTLNIESDYVHPAYKRSRGSAHAENVAISSHLMDSIFLLGEGDLSNVLQNMMQSFGCTYICLWSYSPQPSNCLWYKNGYLRERSDRASSSSESLAQRLFTQYRKSLFLVDNSHIPGLAFQNNLPYLELNSADVQRLASTETQRQFYQEAGIKIAVFLGYSGGEMELGFSDDFQVNLKMEMRNRFPEDVSRQLVPRELPQQPTDQNPRAASSSSSLRSLSCDSPEYSPLLLDIPTSGYIQEPSQEAIFEQALKPAPSVFTTASPHQQSIRALSQIRNTRIPTIESEDAVMTKAILAVISSASSASSSLQPLQILPPSYPVGERTSAFKWYRSALAPIVPMSARYRRQNMLKKSLAFLKSLNTTRTQEHVQPSRTSTTQLHHMISERRRREKLNESFQALKSLLPPGTKKDKASVLNSTTEYLSSLKAQVAELGKRNQILESQLLPQKAAAEEAGNSSNQRIGVRITHVAASTSEARMIDLQVTRRGEFSILDTVVTLLEFLKTDQNLSLTSIEANTTIQESTSINRVILRLKIEGDEWDESAFQEAVRRVVHDLAQ